MAKVIAPIARPIGRVQDAVFYQHEGQLIMRARGHYPKNRWKRKRKLKGFRANVSGFSLASSAIADFSANLASMADQRAPYAHNRMLARLVKLRNRLGHKLDDMSGLCIAQALQGLDLGYSPFPRPGRQEPPEMQAVRRNALAKRSISVQCHANEGGSSGHRTGHTIHGLADTASRITLRKGEHLFCRIQVALVTAPTYTTMSNNNNGAVEDTDLFFAEQLDYRDTGYMPAAGLDDKVYVAALSDPTAYPDGQTPTAITVIGIEWVALTGQRLRKIRGPGTLLIASYAHGDNKVDNAWRATISRYYSRPTQRGKGMATRLSRLRTMRRSLASPREAVRAALHRINPSPQAAAPPG